MLKRALALGSLASLFLLLGAVVLSILTLVGCHSHRVTRLSLFEVRDPNGALSSQFDKYKVGQDGICSYSQDQLDSCQTTHHPYYFQSDQINGEDAYPASSSFGRFQHRLRRLMRVAWILLITTAAVDGFGIICLLLVACVPFIAIPVYIVLGCAQILCLAAAVIDTIIAYRVRHHINKDGYMGVTAHINRGGLATVWSSFAIRMLVVGLMFYLFSVYYKHHKDQKYRSNNVEAVHDYDGEYVNRPVAYVEAPTELNGQRGTGYTQGAAPVPLSNHTPKPSIDPNCTKCQGLYDVDPNCTQCRKQMSYAEKSTLGSPVGSNSYDHKLE